MKFQLIALVAAAQAIKIKESAGQPSCGEMADMIYKHCDKNGDKGISWKEAKQCGAPKEAKAGFTYIDADGDGIVDKGEFVSFCKKHMGGLAELATKDPSCSDIADMVYQHCDKNGDKGISWKEAKGCGAPKEAKPVFEHIDADGDGIVDKGEFVSACKKHMGLAQGSSGGPPDCSEVADMVFDHCDGDHDGELSWAEASKCGAPEEFHDEFTEHAGDNGTLDHEEFVDGCEEHTGLAQRPSCGEMADMIYQHCDKNGDKGISWKEAKQCGAPKEAKAGFKYIDADGDGIVDKQEFVSFCKKHM